MMMPWPSRPWQATQRSVNNASPLFGSSFANGICAAVAIVFLPRQGGLDGLLKSRDSQVRYAAKATTSGDLSFGIASGAVTFAVAFSLRSRHSITRSLSVIGRPARLLYSGK